MQCLFITCFISNRSSNEESTSHCPISPDRLDKELTVQLPVIKIAMKILQSSNMIFMRKTIQVAQKVNLDGSETQNQGKLNE